MADFKIAGTALAANPAPQLPIAKVLDLSGSMFGEAAAELNRGIGYFYHVVNGDHIARYSADVCIIGFSDAAKVIVPFQSVRDASPPQIEPDGGSTSLGAGLDLALDQLIRRKQHYKANGIEYFQPVLTVVSDGCPTDDTHERSVARIAALEAARKLSVFAVGVGPAADMEILASISTRRPPLHLKSEHCLKDFFAFMADLAKVVSRSAPDTESVKLPTAGLEKWAEL